MNGPLRKRCTSESVETDDFAVRYSKELFAIVRPGEGAIVRVGDFDWDMENKVTALTVVNRNGCPSRGGDEASVG